MDVELNATDILEIAERIEQNGADFYQKAADIFDDQDISQMFIRLAEWENKHECIFANMRRELLESAKKTDTYIPSGGELSDAKIMAGLAVFGIKPEPNNVLSGRESEADIISGAIEREKDSIVFYSGLKDFAPSTENVNIINSIINEELEHIRILNRFRGRRE